ncbi:signal peptidase I [Geofilum sp. OHC36d9]|uniref:signal peptidase I n=1 Tax=Geofilum sp. OHC36d9 TaxID=3458413 RepID=UPI004033FC2B
MTKFFRFLFPIIILFHLLMGIVWLSIAWGVAWSMSWILTSSAHSVANFRKKIYLSYPFLLVGVIVVAVFFKTLIFGIYNIPSGSMKETLVPGDVVWVNSMAYGPRLPYSPYEISWVNVLVWLWEGKKDDMTQHWWAYRRLKGFGKPKCGDVVVFNHPTKGDVFIKRLVALPGDTLQIIEGSLFINGVLQPVPSKAIYYSKIRFRNEQVAYLLIDSLSLPVWRQSEPSLFNGFLTHDQIYSLAQHAGVLHAGIDPIRADTAWQVYPKSQKLDWSIDNYGPYVLPYKGMAIVKNPKNLELYGRLIAQEGNGIGLEGEDDRYCFEHDYFFMLGDNFHDSGDSRYFGPVNEELLIGKASFILFSKSDKYKKLERFFCRVK